MTSSNRNLAEIPDHALSLYDGRHHLGWTLRRGKSFEAVRHDRSTVGVFDSLLKASNAVWVGQGGAI